MRVLRDKGVPATFHIVADFLPGVKGLVRKIVADGHLLGMRFDTRFTDLRKLSESQLRRILERDRETIYEYSGVWVKYVRLPYEGYGSRELKILDDMGFVATVHNLDSYDFKEGAVIPAFKAKLKECRGGKCQGIISVQRESSVETAKRLNAVIDMIDEVGYNFVRLDKCVG